MVNRGGGPVRVNLLKPQVLTARKRHMKIFSLCSERLGLGMGPIFCSHRLGKSFSVDKEPVLPLRQHFSETVNFHNTGENQSHLERKRLAEATDSKSSRCPEDVEAT